MLDQACSRADPGPQAHPALPDRRFRDLMSPEAWDRLAPAIRRRFSKRLRGGDSVVYVGEILETWMSPAGWCLAQAARLVGGPLPTARDAGVPSVVAVTEDVVGGGQVWTRLYARRTGFPQMIHSAKRFGGPTGVEEYLGHGLSMALTLHEDGGALVFRSRGYAVEAFGFRLALPTLLSPGSLKVTHAEAGTGAFTFTLELTHARLGLLLRQVAAFREQEA